MRGATERKAFQERNSLPLLKIDKLRQNLAVFTFSLLPLAFIGLLCYNKYRPHDELTMQSPKEDTDGYVAIFVVYQR